MIQKILISQIRKKIEKGVCFKLKKVNFEIYYLENKFYLICEGINNENFVKNDAVENYTDLSDILLSKIKNKIDANRVDRLDLIINFENSTTVAVIYYLDSELKKIKTELNDIL